VLGGSSSINGLIYARGQPKDFDHWAQLDNRGWLRDDVLRSCGTMCCPISKRPRTGLLATDPKVFRDDATWLDAIDWSAVRTRPQEWQDEDYGLPWSRRVWNKNPAR
jgi:hypothetical protein